MPWILASGIWASSAYSQVENNVVVVGHGPLQRSMKWSHPGGAANKQTQKEEKVTQHVHCHVSIRTRQIFSLEVVHHARMFWCNCARCRSRATSWWRSVHGNCSTLMFVQPRPHLHSLSPSNHLREFQLFSSTLDFAFLSWRRILGLCMPGLQCIRLAACSLQWLRRQHDTAGISCLFLPRSIVSQCQLPALTWGLFCHFNSPNQLPMLHRRLAIRPIWTLAIQIVSPQNCYTDNSWSFLLSLLVSV